MWNHRPLVSFEEGKNKITMKVFFLIIPCESIYNDILGRSFLESLDEVASTVLLKMKYHNSLGELVVIAVDLHGARFIH